MEDVTGSTTAEQGLHSIRRRPHIPLVAGLVLYGTSLLLFSFQATITASPFFTRLSSLAGVLADYLWSAPSALACILFLLFTSLLYVYTTKGKKAEGYRTWIIRFPSFIKYILLFLFFIYSLFPLAWAQRSFSRSLESFPDCTLFDFILTLLITGGTMCCSLYLFNKLPLKITIFTEKSISSLTRWKPSVFIGTSLILCFLVTGIIAYVVLDHIPHVQDSIAQLFQAKIFTMGKLSVPSPPHKEFFDYTNIINDGKWYSQYPPGHSLLLTIGLFAGSPWLVGPLLGTLSLVLFFLIVKTIYRECRMLYVSCGLMLCSPFFLFMSSNHMNHSSTMCFMLLFLYFYVRMGTSSSHLYSILAGLSLGYAITIRPLTACAIAAPFFGYLLIRAHKSEKTDRTKVISFIFAVSLMVVLLLLYNALTTGDPLLFGYHKKYQSLGFLGSTQVGPPHTLKGGVINTSNNLIGLNFHLFGWPLPSLIFVFVFFALPLRKNTWDYLFLTSSLTLITSYFFYYYQDLCFGPRFYYSLTPFMIILTVRCFLELPTWLQEKGFDRNRTEASLYLFLMLCILYMMSFTFPSLVKKYSNDYWWVTDKIHKEVIKQGITNAIIFIDVWHPPGITEPNYIPYGSGFQFNSPDLKDDVIYAMDLREKNSELMKGFPQRQYYLCKIHSPMADFSLLKIDTGEDQ